MDIKEASLKLHREHQGKLEVGSKIPLCNAYDLSLAYTPGVAEPCLAIKQDKELSFAYTCRGNMVAVISDGTRVLGLGDIGPEAGMPVMEGKAILYKLFADIDAVPLCLDTKDAEEFIRTVRILQPTFAGINLEDIESPKCYDIEDALNEMMDIPVFHDDQHGTAIAAVAATVNALRFVKKDMTAAKIVVNGAGAAGTAIVSLLLAAGANNVIMLNSKGIMYEGMDMARINRVQAALLPRTNRHGVRGGLKEAAADADVLIGVSSPGAFTAEVIAGMNSGAAVFSLCNPVPEISYEEAIQAGAAVAGTGRSDAPNQVNNMFVFPGIFRGALDVRARKINEEMKLAAVAAIANLISDAELRADHIMPAAFDREVAAEVAAAVAQAAMDSGVARVQRDADEIKASARQRIQELNFKYCPIV